MVVSILAHSVILSHGTHADVNGCLIREKRERGKNMTKYAVESNHGCSIFFDLNDAVSCIILLADYHPDLDVRYMDVEHQLSYNGRFEAFPLSVYAFDDPDED